MDAPTRAVREFLPERRRDEADERVASLLEGMTVAEKVGQLVQVNGGFLTGTPTGDSDVERAIADGRVGSLLNAADAAAARHYQELAVEESRLGIPLLFARDVVHGYRTVFPVPLAEAATWDLDAVEAGARVAATEAAADGLHWTFAPAVDVSRDPRWGRVTEGAGEDPYLGSEVARARVRGFQGEDLSADDTLLSCPKHYVAYGASEAGREYNTVDVSETRLREQHLPPFAAAVEAGAGSVMSSFNVVDRIPATASGFLLGELLRGELGFAGFVVSDWNAVGEVVDHGAAADLAAATRMAFEAGTDVDMVGGGYRDHLADLVDAGDVEEAALDRAVGRVLALKAALGLFEDPYRSFDDGRAAERILTDAHRETARDVARDSQVLLSNEGDRLPLAPGTAVALVGELADAPAEMLGAWSFDGRPEDVLTLRETLEARHGDDVRYAEGVEADGSLADGAREAAVDAAADADVVVAAVGEPAGWSGEGGSRTDVGLPGEGRALLEALVETGTPVVAVVFSGRPLAIEWTAEHVPAVLQAWFPGVEAGPAVADVLYGDADPGGRLPMTVPRNEGQIPVYYNHLSTGRPLPGDVPVERPPADGAERYVSRYIDAPNAPLFPFGHGESYARFAYRGLALDAEEIGPDGALTASVTVENVGDRAGAEVVQLYVHDRVGSRARPVKELAGFAKVRLDPGESRTVDLEVAADDLAFWTAEEEWTAEPGAFDVLVGRSAEDVRLEDAFELVT